MLAKIDMVFLARVARVLRYLDRYGSKPGRHRS